MEKEELYRIHIQRRTEAGEWEDIPQIQKETTGFILLQSAHEGKGVQSSLVNVTYWEIALFLMHVKAIRNVIIKFYHLFLLADKVDAGNETAVEMDAEAMLTQLGRRAEADQ